MSLLLPPPGMQKYSETLLTGSQRIIWSGVYRLAMQLTTHRTPAPTRVAVMSEYIGRLQAEIARRQAHIDALAGSPWNLLIVDPCPATSVGLAREADRRAR
jgi:hypothetical protein